MIIDSVVLDLDHTLIYCPDNVVDVPKNSFHLKSHRVFLDGRMHVIFERPFLREFMQGLGSKKIAVWTAASSDYADFIVHNILVPYLLPHQKIEFLWHRTHCSESTKKYGILKHLELLGAKKTAIDPKRAILIDDNTDVRNQIYLVYTIPQFETKHLDDVQLMSALDFIKNYDR